jgi:hypothetical protein
MKKFLIISGAVAALIIFAAGCGTTTANDTTAPPAQSSSSAPAATPSTDAAHEQFAGDMRQAYSFDSSVVDSDMASFADQVCSDLSSNSVADEVPVVSGMWTDTSKGDAINMITMAVRDVCPSQQFKQTVTYIVTGSPADVTYGPSGSNHQGYVPMKITEPLGSPSYYAINAQLNGGGRVTCKLKVDGVTLSTGSASGDYNIASCQIGQNITTGAWENEN